MRAIRLREGGGFLLQLARSGPELIPHIVGHADVEQIRGREPIEHCTGDTLRDSQFPRHERRVPPSIARFHECDEQRDLFRRSEVAVHEFDGRGTNGFSGHPWSRPPTRAAMHSVSGWWPRTGIPSTRYFAHPIAPHGMAKVSMSRTHPLPPSYPAERVFLGSPRAHIVST